ncbi:hypothetical protein E2C01_036071 [Portunus trituberculatus]|uniref:Uncharacterized protein n=1 Tax=Portunus trituberculatus TaxID=210409 RepID=A0A5B7FB13_PORTR|nr:hypothetical protein [Portunus trituberculatus]
MREARDTSKRSGRTCRGSQELRRVGDPGMVHEAKTAGGDEERRRREQGREEMNRAANRAGECKAGKRKDRGL